MHTDNSKPRVLVIGLDGATFEIIKPMVKAGKLPNFARLMREGSYGPLKSVIPPITPIAWPSFATGKDPSKHGLYDFNLWDFSLPEGHPKRAGAINSTFLRAKSLWKILSEAGKRSIVIDVPVTYPPEKINGIIVSRVWAPEDKSCTYPKSLYNKLMKYDLLERDVPDEINRIEDITSIKEMVMRGMTRSVTTAKDAVKIKQRIDFGFIKDQVERSRKLSKWLMQKEAWDLFVVVFMAADSAGHQFWGLQSKIKKIYEKLDEIVGELFELAGDKAIKLIMSDHGFTSCSYLFNIDEWLFRKKLLFKKVDISSAKATKQFKGLIKKSKGNRLRSQIEKKPYKRIKYVPIVKIDYSKTKAYLQSYYSSGIRINLEGRDAHGIVKKKDYEPLRDYIIRELRKMHHPHTGEKIFSHILKKEKAYSKSPYGIGQAPDILLITKNMKLFICGMPLTTAKSRLFKKVGRNFGFHNMYGIFFACGKEIKNIRLNSLKITDIVPTILHILDVPVPEDIDGRTLREIFKPGSKYAKQRICYQAPSIVEKEKIFYSETDEEKVRKNLARLGYL